MTPPRVPTYHSAIEQNWARSAPSGSQPFTSSQRHGGHDRQCGGRADARAAWHAKRHGAIDQSIQAAQRSGQPTTSGLLRHELRGATRVVAPMAALRRRQGRINRELRWKILILDVAQPDDRVAARTRDQQGVAVESNREDETVVVVRVFADQVDAARRAIDPRIAGTIERVEFLQCAPIAVALRRSARSV